MRELSCYQLARYYRRHEAIKGEDRRHTCMHCSLVYVNERV